MLCSMMVAAANDALGNDALGGATGGAATGGQVAPAISATGATAGPPAEGPGRRERKKRATYLALRAAALDLVSERGFANVTVEDIAEAVDVSVRTFFNYFSSKEDALVGDDPQLRESIRAELLALPGEVPPLDALRHVLVGRLRAMAEDLDLSGEGHEVWARRFAAMHAQPEVRLAYAKHLAVVERSIADTLVERMGGETSRGEAALITAVAMAALRTVTQEKGTDGLEALIGRTQAAFDFMASGFRSGAGSPAVPTGASKATTTKPPVKTTTTTTTTTAGGPNGKRSR